MPSKQYEHFKDFSKRHDMSMADRRKIWLEISPTMTDESFDEMFADQKERQARVPEEGAPAPDFEAERLTGDGKRSGEYVRLSSLKGRPVALVFGSYT